MEPSSNLQNDSWELIELYLSGKATWEQKFLVENWMREDKSYRNLVEFVRKSKKAKGVRETPSITPAFDSDFMVTEEGELYKKVIPKEIVEEEEERPAQQKKIRPEVSYKGLWAGIGLLCASIFLSVLLWNVQITTKAPVKSNAHQESIPQKQEEGKEAAQTAIITEIKSSAGEKRWTQLEDGSVLWLKDASQVSFTPDFNTNKRRISFRGEGVFDIVHDNSKPFYIDLPTGQIKVIGTSFWVKTNVADPVTEIIVKEGIAGYKPEKEGEEEKNGQESFEFVLKNEKLSYYKTSGHTIIEKVVSQNQSAWTDNTLRFFQLSLGNVAADLSRFYKKQVVIADSVLPTKTVTGNFENYTLNQLLDSLSLKYKFLYKEEHDSIKILPSPPPEKPTRKKKK